MGGLRRPDDAAGRAGQDRILALEEPRIGEPAIGLHEHQPRIADLGRDQVHVAPQDGRYIGVDHSGVAAPDEFHQRADFVRNRNLGEADIAGDRRDRRFVIVISITVHEHDGDRPDTVVERGLQGLPRRRFVQRRQHLALGGHSLLDLDHGFVKQFRQFDPAGENIRTVAFRIFRQKLVGGQLAVRRADYEIGERPATVDPELPAGFFFDL